MPILNVKLGRLGQAQPQPQPQAATEAAQNFSVEKLNWRLKATPSVVPCTCTV